MPKFIKVEKWKMESPVCTYNIISGLSIPLEHVKNMVVKCKKWSKPFRKTRQSLFDHRIAAKRSYYDVCNTLQ